MSCSGRLPSLPPTPGTTAVIAAMLCSRRSPPPGSVTSGNSLASAGWASTACSRSGTWDDRLGERQVRQTGLARRPDSGRSGRTAPLSRARTASSSVSLVLPTPASPEISIAVAVPPAACSNTARNRSSSRSRATSGIPDPRRATSCILSRLSAGGRASFSASARTFGSSAAARESRGRHVVEGRSALAISTVRGPASAVHVMLQLRAPGFGCRHVRRDLACQPGGAVASGVIAVLG